MGCVPLANGIYEITANQPHQIQQTSFASVERKPPKSGYLICKQGLNFCLTKKWTTCAEICESLNVAASQATAAIIRLPRIDFMSLSFAAPDDSSLRRKSYGLRLSTKSQLRRVSSRPNMTLLHGSKPLFPATKRQPVTSFNFLLLVFLSW